MDPFLTLLHGFSQSLSDKELSSLKFLCCEKIGKRKLEAVRSGWELFTILIEQQDIAKDDLSFLEGLFENLKRQDLVSQLKRFVEEGEINAPENQPDAHERRLQRAAIEVICDNVGRRWKTLMRQLRISEVQLDRVENAHPRDLREQILQGLRVWQKGRGKDARVTDLIKALRDCQMNLVADKVEQQLSLLNNGTS